MDNGEKYQDKLLNDKAILFSETDPDFANFLLTLLLMMSLIKMI